MAAEAEMESGAATAREALAATSSWTGQGAGCPLEPLEGQPCQHLDSSHGN